MWSCFLRGLVLIAAFGVFFLLELCDVERLVNLFRNRLDLCAQFLLDAMQGESVVVRDEVDGDTQMAESAGPADPVQICLRHLGEVKVDDDVHRLNIDASGEEVGAHEISALARPEVVEHAVTMLLRHLGVNVVARVAEIGDLFGEEFDALCRVAEDDGLVDL